MGQAHRLVGACESRCYSECCTAKYNRFVGGSRQFTACVFVLLAPIHFVVIVPG